MCSRSPALAGTTCGRNGRGLPRQSSNAGELGHISLDVDGGECLCGNRGCLELVVLAGHGFAHGGERYVSAVRREPASRSFARANHDVEVRLSPMADDVGAVGKASMVLHSQCAPQMLDHPSRAGDHPWRVR